MPNSLIDSNRIITEVEDQLLKSGYDIDNDPMLSALVNPILKLLTTIVNQVARYYNRSVLTLASGEDLQEKSGEFAVSKTDGAVPADSSMTNFHVDIVEGVAKDYALDINSPITIPATAMLITDTEDNTYSVANDVVIEPSAFSGYVGISGNEIVTADIPANAIINITVDFDLIGNVDPAKIDDLEFKSNNNKSIVATPGLSTDTEIKDAAYLRVNSMNNSNRDAIRLVLKKLGISSITFRKDMFGAGTLGIILTVGQSSALSETAISIINNTVANVTPFARVVVPEVLKIRMTVEAAFADAATIEDSKTAIKQIVQEYFDGLQMGKQLVPENIKNAVESGVENVTSFKFRCIFIDDRPVLISPQPSLSDQIFEFDGDADDSILFTA